MLDPQHDGWIELSDVEGMSAKDGSGRTINDVGKVKIKVCKRKVICSISIEIFWMWSDVGSKGRLVSGFAR